MHSPCAAGRYSLLLSHPVQRLVAVRLLELFCQQASALLVHFVRHRPTIVIQAAALKCVCLTTCVCQLYQLCG